MTIVRCPRCRDEVTVPAGASKQALVRCPLCLEPYRLEEALGGVPPALEVLADEGKSLAGAATAEDREGAKDYAVARSDASDRPFSARPGTGKATPARPLVSGRGHPKRKEKSVLAEMLKIVGGGVAGLALGLLALWWVFGQDIGDLGPTVARYAPWIVPTSLHGNSTGMPAPRGEPVTAAAGGRTMPPTVQDSGGEVDAAGGLGLQLDTRFEDALGETDSTDLPSTASQSEEERFTEPARLDPGELDDGAALGLTIDDPLEVTRRTSAQTELDPNDAAAATPSVPDLEPAIEPVESPPADVPATEDPATLAPMPDLTDLLPGGQTSTAAAPPLEDAIPHVADLPPSSADEPAAQELRPEVTADQLALAVATAQSSLRQYDEVPRDDKAARQQAFKDFYLAGSEMGRVVSHLEPSASDLSEPLASAREFLQSVAGQGGASKTSAVKYLAGQHWPERKHGEGFLVAGVVKDVQAAGTMFETTLDASVRDRTLVIPIVSDRNLQEIAEPGNELVVVGRVVENPAANLPGYAGEASRVLLYGDSVTAPGRE